MITLLLLSLTLQDPIYRAKLCDFIGPEAIEVPWQGGGFDVQVADSTADPSCAYLVLTPQDWIAVDSTTTSGRGPVQALIRVQPNRSRNARTGSVRLAGVNDLRVVVRQAGRGGKK